MHESKETCRHGAEEHTHKDCGCGHHHEKHEHKHEGCGCGHHHEKHEHKHEGCGCGHHHEGHSHDSCGCGHEHHHAENEGLQLVIGAILFAAGFITNWLNFGYVGTLCHGAAYLLLGYPIIKLAVKNIVRGHVFDENFLMSIASIGAIIIGELPEAVGVMLFYRFGEYFEEKAVARSRSQIMEAVDLRPETVTLEDGAVIPAEQAQPGDVLLVRPGDRIPLDGRVLSGQSRVDTAPVTGESVPVSVSEGSALISGCVNISGSLRMVVEKPLRESMVTRILNSVENAAASKPQMDRFITRFSRVYTPIVVLIATATALVPPLLLRGDWEYWVYTALSFLVMSCPCALVLSVPLAFFSGIGTGSRKGILFKGGASIEAAAKIHVVAMDKTGTLTKGEFRVQEVTGDERVLRLCAACEQASSHPIARSICKAAEGMTLPEATQVEELAGLGIRATVEGKQLLCGNMALLERFGMEVPTVPGTVVYLAEDGQLLGYIRIGDSLKPESKDAVKRLRAMDLETAMVTGDNAQSAGQVAGEAGITRVYASLLPEQKLSCVQTLRSELGQTMFVGDGINDAPVLAGADVGAAMGSGADAAIEAADVVFMTSRADAIPEAIAIARQTQAVAWQNVIFALAVKALVMLLGLLGYASMWLAVFADSGVAMLCVLNAVRLLYQKKK